MRLWINRRLINYTTFHGVSIGQCLNCCFVQVENSIVNKKRARKDDLKNRCMNREAMTEAWRVPFVKNVLLRPKHLAEIKHKSADSCVQ
jgi:hypothetical protein